MIYLAIDPGVMGAMVALSPAAGLDPSFVSPLPVTLHDTRTAPDIVTIMGHLALYPRENLTVVLEQCAPHMPHATSLRSMALGCGMIEGMLLARRYRYATVPAQRWQKEMLGKLAKGETKPAALAAARRLWPRLDAWAIPSPAKKPHGGIIDAALLAEYARRRGI